MIREIREILAKYRLRHHVVRWQLFAGLRFAVAHWSHQEGTADATRRYVLVFRDRVWGVRGSMIIGCWGNASEL